MIYREAGAWLSERKLKRPLSSAAFQVFVYVSDLPAVASSATSSSCPAVCALFLGTRFVDDERPSTHLRTVQRRNGFLCFLSGRHFHKPESSRLTGIPIGNHFCGLHRTILGEQLTELLFGGGIGKTAHI
jgi:hypothetical protein